MRRYPALRVRPAVPAPEFFDLVAAALDGFGVLALQEDSDGGEICAFFADGAARGDATASLRAALPGVQVEAVDVPDDNWAERSQAMLRAVKVRAVTIAPPWDVPADDASTIVIILPSMGFGTGHHATTRLCLHALQEHGVAGKTVLDVGTGSGVLALAAAKLGAADVTGIDNDPDAIANARENMALNAVQVDLRCEALDGQASPRTFDLVLANLTGATLAQHAGRLKRACAPDGALIVSGLREEEETGVRDAFGWRVMSRSDEEGWVCLVLTQTGP